MALRNIDKLNVSEDKKEYMRNNLFPLLEELVRSCLSTMTPNAAQHIAQVLKQKKGVGISEAHLQAENDELRLQIQLLKEKNTDAHDGMKADKERLAEHKEEDSEEEESDGDCDEIPEEYRQTEASRDKTRISVSAEAYGEWNQKQAFTPPKHDKTDEQRGRLKEVLLKSFLFAGLEDKEMTIILDAMEEVKTEKGGKVINQGDNGDFLFVVESGSLGCYIKKDGAEKNVMTCRNGDVFGELALLYNCPRAASVQAEEACVCWKLDRNTFNHIVKDAACAKRERYIGFLKSVPLLEVMDSYELSQIADALKPELSSKDTMIVTEGASGDKFYIIEEGELKATKNGETVLEYKAGDYFGELALLHNTPRAASVVVTSDQCKLLCLDRKSFNRLLGKLSDMLDRAKARYT